MDSRVKQLQQEIPLKFQTMKIKFAPLQTANLSRAVKLPATFGGHFAPTALTLLAKQTALRGV